MTDKPFARAIELVRKRAADHEHNAANWRRVGNAATAMDRETRASECHAICAALLGIEDLKESQP